MLRTAVRALQYLLLAAASFVLTIFMFGLAYVLGLTAFTIGAVMGLISRDPGRIAAAGRWTASGLAIIVGPSVYLALAILR
jgi:hypothetical protein